MLTHEPEALGRDGVVDGFIVVGGLGRSGVVATAASSLSIECSDDLFYAFFFSRNNHRFIYSYIHSTLSLYLYNGYGDGLGMRPPIVPWIQKVETCKRLKRVL